MCSGFSLQDLLIEIGLFSLENRAQTKCIKYQYIPTGIQ